MCLKEWKHPTPHKNTHKHFQIHSYKHMVCVCVCLRTCVCVLWQVNVCMCVYACELALNIRRKRILSNYCAAMTRKKKWMKHGVNRFLISFPFTSYLCFLLLFIYRSINSHDIYIPFTLTYLSSPHIQCVHAYIYSRVYCLYWGFQTSVYSITVLLLLFYICTTFTADDTVNGNVDNAILHGLFGGR